MTNDIDARFLSAAAPLRILSDNELLDRLNELIRRSRRTEADLVAHIGEVDARRLYTREACSSMFTYCVERLHLSEAEAFLRIAVARASREHPMLLEMLADGRLHLSGIALLAPQLTAANRESVLARAVHKSKRQIAELVAELSPRPDAAELIRRLPERPRPPATFEQRAARGLRSAAAQEDVVLHAAIASGGDQRSMDVGLRPDAVVLRAAGHHPTEAASATAKPHDHAVIEPIAPTRYKVQFTATAALCDKLERLRALMRSSVPGGDLATIIEDAVTEKLARLEAGRFGRTEKPRKSVSETDTNASSRHIPAAVRRAVRERDGAQCAYRDDQGRRCSSRDHLEYHHRRPYAYGGDHAVGNVSLLCRAHNAALAAVDYGGDSSKGAMRLDRAMRLDGAVPRPD